MKLENLSELFWRKIRYVLLFVLAVVIMYVVQTKFMLKIPEVNNNELLEAIGDYEVIIEKQKEYAERIKEVHGEITEMDFDIHQVQKQDEINRKVFVIRSIYKDNKMNSKYLFGIQSANVLQIYFNTREEHSSLIKNKKIILDNLNECKANI